MNMLSQSLGLDQVEADPNAIPDGKYDGVVFKSEYVLVKSKGQVAHAITYKVTSGDRTGAQVVHWFTLGEDVKDASGNFPEKVDQITSYTPTMSEQNKQWYKKAFVDLGIPEDQVSSTPVESLIGKEITFGVKKNGNFRNVNFVELREPSQATTQSAPVSLAPDAIANQL